jgi:ketosteroid isomerase-like protein
MQETATTADVTRLGMLLADDVVYEHPSAGFRIVGRDAVLAAIAGHLGETRRASSAVRRRVTAPGAAAIEEELIFEMRDATRWTPVRRRQLLFLEHRAGRLTRVIEYWDR